MNEKVELKSNLQDMIDSRSMSSSARKNFDVIDYYITINFTLH